MMSAARVVLPSSAAITASFDSSIDWPAVQPGCFRPSRYDIGKTGGGAAGPIGDFAIGRADDDPNHTSNYRHQLRNCDQCNALLGAAMVASPWIFRYVEDPVRAWNSAVVGVLVVILACVAETAPETWTAEDDDYHPAAGGDYTYSVPPDKAGEPAIWYASTNYGQAGLGDPERPGDAWNWRQWIFGAPANRGQR